MRDIVYTVAIFNALCSQAEDLNYAAYCCIIFAVNASSINASTYQIWHVLRTALVTLSD